MRILLPILLCFAATAWSAERLDAPANAPVSPPTKPSGDPRIVEALRQAAASLTLPPEQKKIFEDEAIKDAPSFVTDDSTTDVKIDKTKLVGYLRFGAPLFAGSSAGMAPKLCLRVRLEPGCAECARLAGSLESLLSRRFSDRGFKIVSGAADRSGEASASDAAFEAFVTRALEAHCDGALYGQVSPEHSADSSDDEDSDMRLVWTTALALRDLSGRNVRAHGQGAAAVPKGETSAEAADASAAVLASRSIVELFSQATGRAGQATPMALGQDASRERFLKLTGVTSFALYSKFKQLALGAIPDLKLEERIISPGEFDFAVPDDTDLGKLARSLKATNWNGSALSVVNQTTGELTVVLK